MYDDSLLHRMRTAEARAIEAAQQRPAVRRCAPPALPCHDPAILWQNTMFVSSSFRHFHIELFEVPRHFAVLHVCILPHVWSRAPIFGFDMIAGPDQATGIFLDFSPVTGEQPVPCLGQVITDSRRVAFQAPRAAPLWGSIFSRDFFAIRPADRAEVEAALTLADIALGVFLDGLPEDDREGMRPADPAVLRGQAQYAVAQRQNPHTFRMLSRHVGQTAARTFIETVLFPLPHCMTGPDDTP